MEEQNKAKVVNINDKKGDHQKLSYEQLNDVCNQLWQQNKQYYKRYRELEQILQNKRLDYLFKILEYQAMFDSDFVLSCQKEIQEAMTIPQEPEEKKGE